MADASLDTPLLGSDARNLSASDLRSNFSWFACMFAITLSVVTTPLVISTSVLDMGAGYIGNALLNVLTVVSSFSLAAPTVANLGPKSALMCAMFMYCVYAALFAAAILVGSGAAEMQYVLFGAGSCCGGLAAGILWTSQGVYFSKTVDLLQKAEGVEAEALSAELAGTFASLFLGLELVAKLLWGALDYSGIDSFYIASGFTGMGFVAFAGMSRVVALQVDSGSGSCLAKFLSAAALWRDPAVFLLSGLNLTFGFSAAFMNGYVNANYTKEQLGSSSVMVLAALTSLVAAGAAKVFALLGAAIGKPPVVLIGAICFAGIPLSFFALGCCDNWGAGLVVLYVLQGTGRAVYESTNKGVFRDFFPESADAAFANCMLQSSLAFASCFFLSGYLAGKVLAKIALALAVFTPIALQTATVIRRNKNE